MEWRCLLSNELFMGYVSRWQEARVRDNLELKAKAASKKRSVLELLSTAWVPLQPSLPFPPHLLLSFPSFETSSLSLCISNWDRNCYGGLKLTRALPGSASQTMGLKRFYPTSHKSSISWEGKCQALGA